MIKILTLKASNKKINNKSSDNNYNLVDVLLSILLFSTIIIIILNPKKFSTGTIDGLKLFFYSVFPALFPFMLLTKLLTELGVIEKFFSKFDKISYLIFGTPGISIYTLFMSIISGYPIGAKIISELYQKDIISSEEAQKMSVFCTTSGPSFVIGTVGTIMFNNYKFGLILYFSHILSSIVLGVIFNIFSKNKRIFTKNKEKLQFFRNNNIIGFCITETIKSLLIIGSYITIFYLIGEILDSIKLFTLFNNLLKPIFNLLNIDSKYSNGLIYGILEVTRGSKNLSLINDKLSLILTSGLISFSGLSIIFQSMAFLKQTKIKTHTFIFSKCVHSLFSMILCFIFIKLFA
ncbi:MAG: hypothetical protein IJX17_04050 [Clostridia bacterium]|nr:hypothetical protein [Clostridia bacterium]